jgi:hypothetical protein
MAGKQRCSGVINFCECLRQYLSDWSLLAFHSVFSGAKNECPSEPVAQAIISMVPIFIAS